MMMCITRVGDWVVGTGYVTTEDSEENENNIRDYDVCTGCRAGLVGEWFVEV